MKLDKNKRQIVVMVVMLIILILSLIGILLYYVYTHDINDSKEKYDNELVTSSTTTSSTTTITTTTSEIIDAVDKEELINNIIIHDYMENLKLNGKIGEYSVENIKVLNQYEICEKEVYDVEKIYVRAKINYVKLDNEFILANDEVGIDGNYEVNPYIVLQKVSDTYFVERMYGEC